MPSKKDKKSDLDTLVEVIYMNARMTPDDVPSGWYPPEKIAKAKNVSIWTAKRMCMLAVKQGKAEAKFFKVQDASKHIQKIKHYKLI